MKTDLLNKKEKHALLGEMFENIIHQFKQPLNAITTEATGIKFQHEMDMITDEILYESLDNISERVNFLSDTIDDFRDFLKDDKEKIYFNIQKNIARTQSIILPILKAKGIKITKVYSQDDITYFGFDREFSQVIINILNNAKDAILLSNVKEKVIKIEVIKEEEIKILIHDNAGGIPEDIINNIFDDHFTTKEKTGGTGIGLNMSKIIIEDHFKGKLKAYNARFALNEDNYYGACFEITLPNN